jgi:eukaryotic-like serine/threonine-protein kinase
VPTHIDSPHHAPPTTSITPPIIANHEILSFLDQGSSARIWHGRHQLLDHHVALKVALGAPFDRNSERRKTFLNEALLTRTLHHRNLVPVFDVGLTETGDPFFSMTLADRTLSCANSLIEKVEALEAVGSALQYLHDRGIVHCDVKPSNVLLVNETTDPRWVLADLGLAWNHQHPVVIGTGSFGFVAPERFTSSPPTAQSDVYSFARLAQVLLLPDLEGLADARTVGALLHSSLSSDPLHRPTVPQDLVASIREVIFREVDEY